MKNLKEFYWQKYNWKTEYEGREYTLTADAEISHSTKIRIGNSVLYLGGIIYEAPCLDGKGNVCTAYWVADPEVEMPEDSCNWEKADYVELEI